MSDLITDIKSYPISSIIGRYCHLTSCGTMKKKSRCPFHQEKTPSFYIDDANGFFKCFGCNEGGDVFTFIQKKHGCDFQQAIDIICSYLGIDKTKYQKKDFLQTEKQNTFFETINVVNQYFIECLQKDKEAINYVSNIRNFSKETIKEFNIGLATNNINDLLKYCQQKGIREQDIFETGIIKQSIKNNNKNNNIYLFFRNRIIIPIHNSNNKIVAFGGRVYQPNDENAKYLNSSENDNFKKGQILFNLNRAKKNITKENQLIIVEGYMDVIALWQAGFKTGVAPLGTSITETHLKMILQYSKNPIFIFDSDVAGQKASIRACEMLFDLMQTGIVPKFLTLKGAKDCDEFLQKYSISSFKEQLKNSLEINEFIFDKITQKYNYNNPNEKAKLEKEIISIINKINDDILKQNYKNFIKDKLFKLTNKTKYNYNINNKEKVITSNEKNIIKQTNLDFLEKKIIISVLLEKSLLEDLTESGIINRFSNNSQQFLSKMIVEHNNKNIQQLCDKYDIHHIDKDIFSKLCIQWEWEYEKRLDIDLNIKQQEKKRILEKKKKYFKQLILQEEGK